MQNSPENYYNNSNGHQGRAGLAQGFVHSHFEEFFSFEIGHISPLKSHVTYFYPFFEIAGFYILCSMLFFYASMFYQANNSAKFCGALSA